MSDTTGPQGRLVRSRPRGLMRALLRFPIWLYRLGLGWIFDKRFLLLTHIGRRTGLPHQAVVEIVDHDAVRNTYVIASGWGRRSDWYRNIRKTPQVTVQVGRQSWTMIAVPLNPQEAAAALGAYAHRYPRAFRALARGMLGQVSADLDVAVQETAQVVPLIELRPYP